MGEWRVKFDGVCSRCGIPLPKGTPAVSERATHTIRCIDCPVQPPPPPPPLLPVVDPGVAGRSARAKGEKLAARRDAAITERWGTGFVAKVVRAVSDEPQSTRAWVSGAEGEEAFAAELAQVIGLRMLHDRRVPGTRGNVDHILIGPAGVFVVDAKAHHGRIAIQDRGGLFRIDNRLTVNGRDCSSLADAMGWQVGAVQGALAEHGIDPMPPVTPVLCFVNVEWPLFRAPSNFRGVRIEGPRSLMRLVGAPILLTEPQVDYLAGVLSKALPPK